MDYGMTFTAMLETMEQELAALDGLSMATEVENINDASGIFKNKDTTMTRSAEQARKTDVKGVNDQDQSIAKDTTQDFVKKVEENAEQVLATLDRVNKITTRLLENTLKANEEFIGQYDELQSTYKLVEDQVLINWSYAHNAEQYLHSKITKLRAVITTNANYLSNWENMPESAIINKKGKELDKELLSEMGAPSSIDTLNEFFGHLRSQFRGRKSEKTYRGEMANALIQEVRQFSKVRSTYTQDIAAVKRIATSVQNTCIGLMKRSNYIDQDRQRVLVYQRNINRALIVFCNMIQFVYRLHVEYITNRRILITRLYEK